MRLCVQSIALSCCFLSTVSFCQDSDVVSELVQSLKENVECVSGIKKDFLRDYIVAIFEHSVCRVTSKKSTEGITLIDYDDCEETYDIQNSIMSFFDQFVSMFLEKHKCKSELSTKKTIELPNLGKISFSQSPLSMAIKNGFVANEQKNMKKNLFSCTNAPGKSLRGAFSDCTIRFTDF